MEKATALFNLLPSTLFQPLAAPSRRRCAATLLRLYDMAQGVAMVEEEGRRSGGRYRRRS